MDTFNDQLQGIMRVVKGVYTAPEHVRASAGDADRRAPHRRGVIAEIHSRIEEFVGERRRSRSGFARATFRPNSRRISHGGRREEIIVL